MAIRKQPEPSSADAQPEPDQVPEAEPERESQRLGEEKPQTESEEARFRRLYTDALRSGAEDGGENAAEIQQLAETLTEQGLDLQVVAEEIHATLAAETAAETACKDDKPEDRSAAAPSVVVAMDATPSAPTTSAARPRTPQRGSGGNSGNAAKKSTPPRSRPSGKHEAQKKTPQQRDNAKGRKEKDSGKQKKKSRSAAPPSKPPPPGKTVEPWRDPNSAEYDPARVKANEAFAKAQEAAGATDANQARKQKQEQQRRAFEAKLANEQVSHDEKLLAEARAVFADPTSSKEAVAAAVAQMNAAAKKK